MSLFEKMTNFEANPQCDSMEFKTTSTIFNFSINFKKIGVFVFASGIFMDEMED